jgi:FAD:protein FMN transferase
MPLSAAIVDAPAPFPGACAPAHPFATRFKAMGCLNEIVVCTDDERQAEQVIKVAAREVLRIEAKYSRYRDDGIITQINQGAGQSGAVECDDETLWLLGFADSLHSLSGGQFDPTSGVLRRAWDFKTPRLPSDAELRPLLALVGWDKVERSGRRLRLPLSGMELDFGGFGKEYAADRAAQLIRDMGVAHGYVNLGGDIAAVGPQPGGSGWPVGVPNPRKIGELIASIPLARGGLTTSGDTEKYFDLGGRRYCHILNPRTGHPVSHWASISVQTGTATEAGAQSTIAMLKEHDGLAFLRAQPCSFLAVGIDGSIHRNQPVHTEHRL